MLKKISKRFDGKRAAKPVYIMCILLICVISFTILLSCASMSKPRLPADYSFTSSLESVDKISTFRIDSWQSVDNRSIILKTDINKYYLLVMDQPMSMIPTQQVIGISSMVTSIDAGFDRIFVNYNGNVQYYTIDKIYKLEGREQANEIKDMLRGK